MDAAKLLDIILSEAGLVPVIILYFYFRLDRIYKNADAERKDAWLLTLDHSDKTREVIKQVDGWVHDVDRRIHEIDLTLQRMNEKRK